MMAKILKLELIHPEEMFFAGWGMTAVISEFEGELTVKVDGVAASMAAYLLLFCNNVECLDISKIMLHPAFWTCRIRRRPRLFLDSVNKDLQS